MGVVGVLPRWSRCQGRSGRDHYFRDTRVLENAMSVLPRWSRCQGRSGM